MAGKHVVVTLTPVYLPDTLPFRTLTLADDEDCISVGRASKSETKQLVPAHNNAWFDSRVMSRNHAVICASLSDKRVLVSDNGSMHGTYINDEQVPIDEEVEIKSGDVLTFGNEVTRWPKDGRPRDPVNPFALDTFSPLKVRCECEWFDDSAEKGVGQKEISQDNSKNSFSVPDDDDDDDDVEEVEVIPETLPTKPRVFSPIHFTIPYSEAEESEDDSEEEEQDPKSSPPTSHPEEAKVSVVNKTEKDSEPKPSTDDSNGGKVKPSSAAPTTESPLYRQLAASVAEFRRSSGLGSEECPFDIEDGRIITPLDRWIEEQKKNPDPIFEGRASSSESDAIPALREPAEPELTSERHWRTLEEPASQPENHADEQRHAEGPAALPSTPESISGSYEQPHIETDREDESNDDYDVSVNNEDRSPYKALLAEASIGQKKDDPVDRHITSPQMYHSKYPSRQEISPEVQAFNKNSGYGMDDWRGPMLGTSDLPPRVPSPSDKALAKPLDAENVDRNPSITSTWGSIRPPSLPPRYTTSKERPMPDSPPLNPMRRAYHDGPFLGGIQDEDEMSMQELVDFTRQKVAPQVHPATAQASRGPCPPWHHESFMSYSNVDFPKLGGYDVETQMRNWRAETGISVPTGPPATRMSISDIVAESNRETHVRGYEKGLKRKASEMEEPEPPVSENVANDAVADGNGVDESLGLTDSIPDAQPQDVVQGNEYSTSQLTELSASKEDVQIPDEEPPRKRMKMTTEMTNTSRPKGNFAKYAATALAGAAIGGVGTLAALVALPPDFFA